MPEVCGRYEEVLAVLHAAVYVRSLLDTVISCLVSDAFSCFSCVCWRRRDVTLCWDSEWHARIV